MKNTYNFQSKKDINGQLSSMSIEDAYEIATGLTEIEAESVEIREIIYNHAFNLVKKDDADFAKLIEDENSEGNKKLAKLISLNQAYDIVGGYKTVDSETYELALAILKDEDPHFAEVLDRMNKAGCSFSSASHEDLRNYEELLNKNIDTAESIFNSDTKKSILEDEEIVEAFKSMNFVDADGKSLNDEDRVNAIDTVVETAMSEAVQDILSSEKDVSNEEAIEKVKSRTLFGLGRLRLNALKPSNWNIIKAFKNNTDSLSAKMRDAFNFKKKVNVSANFVANTFNKVKNATVSFIGKLKNITTLEKTKAKLNRISNRVMVCLVAVSTILPSCNPRHPVASNNEATNTAKVVIVEDTSEVKLNSSADTLHFNAVRVDSTYNSNKLSSAVSDTIAVTDTVAVSDTIAVPTEWSEEMGITQKQWNNMRGIGAIKTPYFVDTEGNECFDAYYGKISNSMIAEDGVFAGKTREQVMLFYKYVSAYNLHAHRDVIKTLDNYFVNDTPIPTEDYEKIATVMNQFTPGGNIKDTTLTGSNIATSRTSEGKLNIQTVSQDEVVVSSDDNSVISTDSTSTVRPNLSVELENFVDSVGGEYVVPDEDPTVKIVYDKDARVVGIVTETTNGIVSDSDTLAIGTPAADNVDERGGHLNSGLTVSQYNRVSSYFTRHGDNAFEDLVDGVKSHPELREKGGIAEGLSAEETLYLLMVADMWGGKGQFKDEVSSLLNYIKGCTETLENVSDIKEVMNRGNINASMDGVVGNRNSRAISTEIGNCGEESVTSIVSDTTAVTPQNPVSKKFPEFYRRTTTSYMPIIYENAASVDTIEVVRETAVVPVVKEYKGNNIDVKDPNTILVDDNAPVEEVTSLGRPKEKKLLVEASEESEVTPAERGQRSRRNGGFRRSNTGPDL